MMFFNRNTGQKSLPNYAPDSGGASGWRRRRQSRTDETRDFNIYGDYEDDPAENVNRRKRSETFWKIWKSAVERIPVKTYRLTDILASKDFVEVIVPKPVLLEQGITFKDYINNELAKANANLGVNLKEEMIYWED